MLRGSVATLFAKPGIQGRSDRITTDMARQFQPCRVCERATTRETRVRYLVEVVPSCRRPGIQGGKLDIAALDKLRRTVGTDVYLDERQLT